MPAITPASQTAIARSTRLKRLNALTATLAGALPALIMGRAFPGGPERYAIGFLVGCVWSNAFEYFYHRSLLHRSASLLARHHMEHHAATGTPAETEHLNFGESPLWVALLFLGNEIVIILADLLLRLRIAPGVLVAFGLYFVVLEEIHWRVHLDGWLPRGLHFAKSYHLQHHDRPDSRFNVFLPLFDWVCGTANSQPLAAVRPTSHRLDL